METKYAYCDGATTLSQEDVMIHTLTGTLPAEVKPMPVGAIDKVTKARIRYGISELVNGNIDNVNKWLNTLAEGEKDPITGKFTVHPQPRAALEMFIELLQFSVPKMKAISVDVKNKDGVSKLSISDLQSIVSDQ